MNTIKLDNMRSEYRQKTLTKQSVKESPFEQFNEWFKEAENANLQDPNACTLATCGKSNMPQARVVLLKRYDKKGFVFFTNYTSAKANDLAFNPKATLNFFWIELERQVRISGECEKISLNESLSYFATRSRGSQLGAWVSNQSKAIESRKFLQLQIEKMKEKFKNKQVPLPDFWGGYRLKPRQIEFWQGRENRLHDRILYSLENSTWKIQRLSP